MPSLPPLAHREPETIGGQSQGVEIPGVTDVVGLQLAVGHVPDLDVNDVLVPAAENEDWIGIVRREPDSRLKL